MSNFGKDNNFIIIFHLYRELQSTSGEKEAPVPSEKLEEQKENLAALRLHLGKMNRSIASMQRQIDEVPARAELAQYQKRFLELYTQGKLFLPCSSEFV